MWREKKKGVEFKINTNANYSKWTCTSKDFYDARYFFVKTVFQYISVFILTSPKLIFVLPTYKTDYYQIVLRKLRKKVLFWSLVFAVCLFVCLFEADVLACHAMHSTEAKILRDGPKTRMRSRVVWIQINEMFCRFSTFWNLHSNFKVWFQNSRHHVRTSPTYSIPGTAAQHSVPFSQAN